MKNTIESVGLIEGLTIAGLLVGFECENADKKTRWAKELVEIQNILKSLKSFLQREEITMSSDMQFFRRTKAPGLPAPAQQMPAQQMPEQIQVMVEKLAAEFNKLRESLLKIEARLTALESGAKIEQKAKTNGHIRSFQSDITTHSRQVKR